jgi:ribulose-phosphate 3-epimerase
MLDEAELHDVRVSVDGGINRSTAKLVLEAGADVLVAGNAVYGAPEIASAIEQLRNPFACDTTSGINVA